MKKLAACLIALFMMCSCLTVQAAGNYMELDGLAFTIENGEAVIHAYNGDSSAVVIPEKLLGAPVTTIDSNAFSGQSGLKSIRFDKASQLRTIGSGAFLGCTGLQELTIPDSVTGVGFGAFQGCAKLRVLSIGNGLTEISSQAFYGCGELTDVVIPDSVENIGAYAFGGCGKLKYVLMPNGTTQIQASAFKGSSQVTVKCYSDSYAQAFAEEQSLPYVLLDKPVLGDVDINGLINISDVTAIQLYLAESEPLNDVQLIAADVNQDGIIDIADATHLQLFLAEYLVLSKTS